MIKMPNEKIGKYLLPLLVFLIPVIFFTLPVIFNMGSMVYGPLYGTDSRGTIWQMWWSVYSFKNNLPYTFHSIVAAPFGNDVSGFPEGPLWSLVIRWLPILAGEIAAYNIMIMLSFVLAGFLVYLITYQITHHRGAALISGLIYSFCPYHFQRAWEHFSLAQIQWPAFYFLMLLALLKQPCRKHMLFFTLAAVVLFQLEFNYFYIGVMCTLAVIVFLFFDVIIQNLMMRNRSLEVFKKEFKKTVRFVGWLLLSGVVFIVVNMPLLWQLLKATAPSASANEATGLVERPFHYLFSHSARLLCYFLPSSANPVLGGPAHALEGTMFYGRGPIEQSLYLGWVGLVLAWFAWKRRAQLQSDGFDKKNEAFFVRFFVFLALCGFIFSMPPYVNLGFFKLYFPSYFMYGLLPMFRAYARFGLVVILAVSVLAGIGFKMACGKLNQKKRFFVSILTVFLIFFEFNNIPPFRCESVNSAPEVYLWLAQQKGDFIVAEYPLEEASRGETYIELDYLLYQRLHKKPILNGIAPGTEGYEVKSKIMKVTDPQTSIVLKALGVKYVVVHLGRYREGTNQNAVDVVGELPDLSRNRHLKLIGKFGDDELYEVAIH